MVAETAVPIAFKAIYQRFGDAAPGAWKPGKHFKRADRLVCFKMIALVVQAQVKGYSQRDQSAGYTVKFPFYIFIRYKAC